jgi:SAM-dependent methyltransferase
MKTDQLFTKYYYSRPEFVDGTTEFHNLCAQFIAVGQKILEIGPGPANATSAFLASRGPVVGVDVSDEVLGNKYLVEARLYNGRQLPFEDASFPACVSNYVLEHIQDAKEHFYEVRRVLRPGGVYCFRTPNLWHYVAMISKALPHGFHLRLANRMRGMAKEAHDPYPTRYAANTRGRIQRLSAPGMRVLLLRTIEKEPSYGRISPALFFPMMAYERLVNNFTIFEGLRANILGVVQKPS